MPRKVKGELKIGPSSTKKELLSFISTIQNDPKYYVYNQNVFPNPDELVSSKSEEIELYDQVFQDPIGYQAFNVRINTLMGKEWTCVPPDSPSFKEKKMAKFLNETLNDTNFDAARAELLKAICYGYYGQEVIYKKSNSFITIDRFVGVHPRKIRFDGEGTLRLLTKAEPFNGEELPYNKIVVFTYGDTSNPYGVGLGRTLWYWINFKHGTVKFWMVFLERFGSPSIVGTYSDPQKKNEMLQALRDIQQSSSSAIRGNLEDVDRIKLLEATRSGNGTHRELTTYCDEQMVRAVLGQTLTSSTSGIGSQALGKIHNVVRQDILESDADLLDRCLNGSIIKWLIDLNFDIGNNRYPKIVTNTAPLPDLKERSEIDKILVNEIGLKVGEEYFYEMYNIPKPLESETLVVPVSEPEVPETETETETETQAEPDFSEYTPEQEVVEKMVAKTIEKLDPVKKEVINQLTDLKADQIYDSFSSLPFEKLKEIIAENMLKAEKHGEKVALDDSKS